MRIRPSVPLAVLAALALAAGLAPAAGAAAKPRLVAFDSCRDLVRYGQAGLARTNGYPGVPMRAGSAPLVIATPPLTSGPTDDAAGGVAPPMAVPTVSPAAPEAGRAGDAATGDFSGTNNQEAGVDEPDVIKTDGRYVYAVSDRTLRVVDVQGDAPRVVGSLPLAGYGHRILLRGTRVLVAATQITAASDAPTTGATDPAIGRPVAPVPSSSMVAPGYADPTTVLTEVDVREPAAPKVARTLEVKGTFVDARLNGGTVRIVIGSDPAPVATGEDGTAATPTVRTFVPRTVLRSRRSGRTFRRDLATCGQIRHPRAFSGAGLLTVMTVDLDRGLYSVDRDAIMAGAQVVYGSPTSLYVASEKYRPALEEGRSVPDGARTEIHRFDASEDGRTTYAGSGDVPGFILGQYALSEHEGVLRVASTEQPPWFPGQASAGETETGVSTLTIGATGLTKRARVGGLGKGERVYAVRFLGDTGYVVTFRQVDPLYVLDLRDPGAPRTVGELKVAGYSAYLHPVGDGLLLGVGQDATDAGMRVGAQVSLFDVSKPSAPTRVAQHALGQGTSAVEFDPHAFLYWDRTRLAVLPVSTYGADPFTGAVGLRVAPTAITPVGTIDHRTADRPYVDVDRSLVVDGKVVSLSYRGLGTSRLDTLAPVGFAAFD